MTLAFHRASVLALAAPAFAIAACQAGDETVTATGAASDGGADATASSAGASDAPIDEAAPEPSACNVTAPTACPTPAPRYADVAPVIAARCLGCHDGKPGGPWSLVDYPHVADWATVVRDDVLTCAMPPPEAGPMPNDERLLILTWVRCGSPE